MKILIATLWILIDQTMNIQVNNENNGVLHSIDTFLYPEYKTSLINNQPVVGILTQPSAWPKLYDPSDFSYLSSSYVKLVEQSGARVVPIRYNLPENQLIKLFSCINGLIIPGGGADLFKPNKKKQDSQLYQELNQFSRTTKLLISQALKINEEGEYFPILGISLGFELMLATIANDFQILNEYNSTNHSQNLKFLKASYMSRIYSRMPERVRSILSHDKSMYFNHKYALEYKKYMENDYLKEFFEILSFSSDLNGKEFISSVEAKEYPFYAIQFHPEKNSFEWKQQLDINHSLKAIESSQYFSDFFIAECRKNDRNEKRLSNFKESKEFKKELIYNYYPIQLSQSFMSVYIFSKDKEKDLYRVTGPKKKRTLTVFEKFNTNQIHNDTHYDENDLNDKQNEEGKTNIQNIDIEKEIRMQKVEETNKTRKTIDPIKLDESVYNLNSTGTQKTIGESHTMRNLQKLSVGLQQNFGEVNKNEIKNSLNQKNYDSYKRFQGVIKSQIENNLVKS